MTEVTLLTAVFYGFLLGVKHALDADHVLAITTIVSRNRSLLRSVLAGVSWGVGHTFTLFAVGLAVLVFKLAIPDKLALSMEFIVGVILVLLGLSVIGRLVTRRVHLHRHPHDAASHSHDEAPGHDHRYLGRPLLIGMVHGLAGSGALTVLVLSVMPSVGQGLFFLLVFGAGSILGMLVFSGLIGLPFRFTTQVSHRLNLWLQGVAGVASIAFGLFMMWEIGFTGGLFVAWALAAQA
ncbi:MAG: sulfite exporter TauE/SafE family protein [Chloroflexi bacterium]|nr:sulfite exporter TauE/SafE family protein [Chloroflexota bacterium]